MGALLDRIIEGLCEKFRGEHSLAALAQDELFESFCTYAVLSANFDDEFDPEEFRLGQGGDLGIDAAGVIINGDLLLDSEDIKTAVAASRTLDVTFVLLQARSSASFEAKTISDISDNVEHLFTSETLSYPASDAVRDLRVGIDAIFADIGKLKTLPVLRLYYASTGKVTEDAHLSEKRASSVRALSDTNYFDRVEWTLVGARELRDLYQRATTAVSVQMSMPKKVSLGGIPGVQQAFLGIIPARELVEMLTDSNGGIRKSLFFENVRDFQDYNPVNKEIQDTLRDSNRRDRFAVLNNGITIVAREIAPRGDDLRLTDFQVVNGCQTCHVLFDEREHLSETVTVSLKLIETRDEGIISSVTEAANRQTAVTDEDLLARERFQKDLEALFLSFPETERLYYERRARQYSSNEGLEKTRIVTRPQLTRSFASMFLDEPARAGRYYKELRNARGEDLFREGQSTYAYYASAASAYRLEWLLRNKRIEKKYATAKYQLLMGIKHYVLGSDPLPVSPRKAETECKKILQVVWSVSASEDLVKKLIEALDAAVAKEPERPVLNRDTVRTTRFTEAFQAEVKKLQ